jgi:SlyX protein
MDQNLVELENRISYLERYIDELNEVVIEQGKTIDRIKWELKTMRDKSESSPVDPSRPADEKPPHY